MKRITFLTALIVSIMSLGTARAQVSAHIGVNIGNPAPVYYAPHRVVVVNRAPVYRYPVRNYYRNRPVIVQRGYNSCQPVVIRHDRRDFYHGHNHGYRRGHGRGRW